MKVEHVIPDGEDGQHMTDMAQGECWCQPDTDRHGNVMMVRHQPEGA